MAKIAAIAKKNLLIKVTLCAFLVALCLVIVSYYSQYSRTSMQMTPAEPAELVAYELIEVPISTQQPVNDIQQQTLQALFAAELAMKQQQYQRALAYFQQAAQLSQNADIARRATYIALLYNNEEVAIGLAKIWADADKKDIDAQQVMLTLLIQSNQTNALTPYFLRILTQPREQATTSLLDLDGQLTQQADKYRYFTALQQLAQQHPQNASLQLALSYVAMQTKQSQIALRAIQRANALHPHWLLGITLQTDMLIALKRQQQALDFLAKQLATQPNNNKLRLAYAQTLIKLGNFKRAHKQLLHLSKAKDKNIQAIAYINLARAALFNNHVKSAKNYLKKARNNSQHAAVALLMLGQIAEIENQYDVAIKWYKQISPGEHYLESRLRIAQLQALQGNTEQALHTLERITARNLSQAKAVLHTQAIIEFGTSQYANALNTLDRALAMIPFDTDLLYLHALCAEKLGDSATFQKDLRNVIAQDPNHVNALNTLGYVLSQDREHYQEALHYITRAFALAPNDPSVLDSMGWIQYRLGHMQQALQYLERAFKLNPDSEIAAHLGEVLWVSGDKQQAQHIWQRALKKTPNNPTLLETIKQYQKN